MAETPPTEQPRRNFYGRRRGKSLKGRQADLVATRLKALSPPGVRRDDNPERAPLDLEALFGGLARSGWRSGSARVSTCWHRPRQTRMSV